MVKEFIHPSVGGNPHGVDKMLVYYNENRLPGTRRKKEEYVNPTAHFRDVDPVPDEEDAEPGLIDGWEELRKQKMALPG